MKEVVEENQFPCYGERIYICFVLDKAETQFFFYSAWCYCFNSIFTKEKHEASRIIFVFIFVFFNEYIRGKVGVAFLVDEMRESRLR